MKPDPQIKVKNRLKLVWDDVCCLVSLQEDLDLVSLQEDLVGLQEDLVGLQEDLDLVSLQEDLDLVSLQEDLVKQWTVKRSLNNDGVI